MKVTEKQLEDLITDTQYYRFPGTNVTVCCLTVENGFNPIGSSACVDDSEFDPEIGCQMARKDAINKLWPLEGYLLAEKMMEEKDGTSD